jgi:hypothetical protein
MEQFTNKIFLGCNYNDKKIKFQFDQLKEKLEKEFPIICVIIDKRAKKSAKDLWIDIQNEISNSSVCIFDVTGFRPNVVLELGFSLGIKNNDQLFITFRERKLKGKTPEWLLSDIGHLNRFPYKNIRELEKFCKDQIDKIQFVQNIKEFKKSCNKTSAPEKYFQCGVGILMTIRNEGEKSESQLKSILEGSNCRIKKMLPLLRANSLIKKEIGRYGRFKIS